MAPPTSLLPPPGSARARHRRERSGPPTSVGRFRCSATSSTWSWSPGLYELLGVAPGGTDPGLDLLLSAVHVDDRETVAEQLRRAFVTGGAVTVQHRLVRPDGEVRRVVLFGELEHDPDGGMSALAGLVLDITPEPTPVDGNPVAQLTTEVEQLRAALVSRATIEQAKGAVMLLTGCSQEAAFDLLAHFSSTTHRKVRDVATAILDSASGRAPLPEDLQQALRDACPPKRC